MPDHLNHNNLLKDSATSKDKLYVRILEQDTVGWETYVTSHSKGTFYHLPQWYEVLRRSYNHHIFLLVAEDDQGSIQGCMPLVQITLPLLGSKLISLPYQAGIGGPIADADAVNAVSTSNPVKDKKIAVNTKINI